MFGVDSAKFHQKERMEEVISGMKVVTYLLGVHGLGTKTSQVLFIETFGNHKVIVKADLARQLDSLMFQVNPKGCILFQYLLYSNALAGYLFPTVRMRSQFNLYGQVVKVRLLTLDLSGTRDSLHCTGASISTKCLGKNIEGPLEVHPFRNSLKWEYHTISDHLLNQAILTLMPINHPHPQFPVDGRLAI